MKITITDISKQAGVSKTTVSRVLNGHFNEVTEKTKNKVLKVIEQLNYTPNAIAKSLKSMKTNVIGMVLTDLKNPFWINVLEGAEDACRTAGFNIMICNACNDRKLEELLIKGLRNKQVDGIISNPTMRNTALFESLIEGGYPLVALNRRIPNLSIETVAVDNVQGAQMATEHLISLGKKQIMLVVYNPNGISPRLERIEGYIQALNKNGIAINDSLIHIIDEHKDATKQLMRQILTKDNRPDAIFSTNNLMTLEILEVVKELDMRIPQDITLIGYDETVWSSYLNLTIVKQPAYDMGVIAAKRLIHLIHTKETKVNTHLFKPELIIRESCGSQYQV